MSTVFVVMNKIPNSEWKQLTELMTLVEGMILDLLNSRIDIQNQNTPHKVHNPCNSNPDLTSCTRASWERTNIQTAS